MIAPNGRATRYCADGELALLQGAQADGTLAALPSSVIPSLPALRAHTPDQPAWQKLYMARDRAAKREVLAIVREAKARAIVLTVDLIPDGRTAPPPPPPTRKEKVRTPTTNPTPLLRVLLAHK